MIEPVDQSPPLEKKPEVRITSIADELDTLEQCIVSLESCDYRARYRVLKYLIDRFGFHDREGRGIGIL